MDSIKQKPWDGIGVEASANLSPRELAYKLNLDFVVTTGGFRPGQPKSYANQETFQFFKSFTVLEFLLAADLNSLLVHPHKPKDF